MTSEQLIHVPKNGVAAWMKGLSTMYCLYDSEINARQ
jgi:hypothetical protein